MSKGPLDGIRVFDLTQWMVGPWASMQLGSLGADIIHIEQPDVDWSTLGAGVPPTINGTSIGYIAWNMNKRAISLDLKSPEDLAAARELLTTCDVFLINMRAGVADRLQLGYDQVAEINSQVVYCSVTGWGETGPMAQRPGADGQLQYFTGLASVTGREGGSPEIYRHFTQMDATTGNYAAQAIMMGLLARKRTGRGQKIEVPMLRAGAALQTARIGEYLRSGVLGRPLGSASQAVAPDQAFLCENAQYIGVSATSERDWKSLCDVLGKAELAEDERFSTNGRRVEHRAELTAILEPEFGMKPRDHWMMVLGRAGVPCGYSMSWEQLRYHQQVTENDYIVEVETAAWGPVFTGGPPWHLSDTATTWTGTPMPGQHTDDVFNELKKLRGSEAPVPAAASAS